MCKTETDFVPELYNAKILISWIVTHVSACDYMVHILEKKMLLQVLHIKALQKLYSKKYFKVFFREPEKTRPETLGWGQVRFCFWQVRSGQVRFRFRFSLTTSGQIRFEHFQVFFTLYSKSIESKILTNAPKTKLYYCS